MDQNRLNHWMWMFMLRTLPKKRIELLKKELGRRRDNRQIITELERKLLAAFTVNKQPRKYLAELIASDEKRKWSD